MPPSSHTSGPSGPAPAADEALSYAGLHPAEVFSRLHSRPEGLRADEAEQRLAQYGANLLPEIRGPSLARSFVEQFTHLMAVLLWVAGLIALGARLPQLGLAIWLVNVVNGLFSFWQEYRAERSLEALRRLLPQEARVLRDGVETRIPAESLVPGDVLLLQEGDRISADARVIWSQELRVDQSTLTGESRPVRKTADAVVPGDLEPADVPNLVFAGTTVVMGRGRAVVVATGPSTEFARIARLTQLVPRALSPLQQEVAHLTRVIALVAVAVGLFFFGLAATLTDLDLARAAVFTLGMIVAFVPEGLLPTVTLALAMGVQRMAARNALVRRLSAVETLGCTTVICTDKTGTLTQNEMTVTHLWHAGRLYTVTGVGYEPQGALVAEDGPLSHLPEGLRLLALASGLCTNARLVPPDAREPRWRVVGDPTEGALRVLAAKAGIDLRREEERLPRILEFPFDSRRKRMTTVHQDRLGLVALTKGAPRELLSLCTQIQLGSAPAPLDDRWRNHILAALDDLARSGLRVLAVAMRSLPLEARPQDPAEVECDLTFLGLLGLTDPPRPEVAEAIARCHRAGIRVIMITGDYGLTAESVARRIGLLRGPARVVTGSELETMDDRTLAQLLSDEVLFARATPEHKLRIVSALQALGHVVAVTGDGVNDAPALRKAHIGIAMGKAGTDVAREAADVVLLDDNFASIAAAVEEGRAVFSNIKKFTTYIFTSNTPEAVPFILFALSGGRIPLALDVMHILSVDLGTDLLPALALGAEPPEPGTMDRPPRRPDEHVVTPSLLARAYLWLGLLQSAAVMAAFYGHYWTRGYWGRWLDLPSSGPIYRAATAMALATVVATQIGNAFAQRTEVVSVFRIGLWSNRLLLLGIAVEVVLLLAIVYLPPLQRIIGTAAFPPEHWLFVAAWTPLLFLADELRKALLRQRRGGGA